jgi:hypothetical protein
MQAGGAFFSVAVLDPGPGFFKFHPWSLKPPAGVFMKPDFNPIIQEQTSDTLAHVNDILAVIQTFFTSSDLPATDYEKSIYASVV